MTEATLESDGRAARRRLPIRIDPAALSAWAMVGGIVLYMAVDGGGFDLLVRSQVGIVVWWVVLVGAVLGLVPISRPTGAWAALLLFGIFVAWTALATTWSQSSERSLQELSRVACYLGILVLAVGLSRDRDSTLRHTLNALALSIVVVAILALTSRLRPGLFPASHQTAQFLPGSQGRLGWPLNYWNALAALVAFGLPLLLGIASSARTVAAQALSAGAIPLLGLTGYLTFSRGGAIADAICLGTFFVLAPDRLPKVVTGLMAGAGSALLIVLAAHRGALERGLTNAAASHQGSTLIVPIVLVCIAVALAQAGVSTAIRAVIPPRWLGLPKRQARLLLAGVAVAAIVIVVAANVPARISHAWQEFKHPAPPVLNQDSPARFDSLSGNGRYDYWKVAVQASGDHLLGGSGPGTFQLVWLPRAPYYSYVQNAHSLYIETLSDVGVVGLAILVAFFVLVGAGAVRAVARAHGQARVAAAAAAAALLSFLVSAAYEWVWQVPALPAAFLLLGIAVLSAPRRSGVRGQHAQPSRPQKLGFRFSAIVLGIACLLVIAVPLAVTNAERRSQSAASRGQLAQALAEARTATRVEPGAASAQLQVALVLELRDLVGPALEAAHRAAHDEAGNWSIWLVISRLEAEAGHPAASVAAFRRARSLNPRSPLFAG